MAIIIKKRFFSQEKVMELICEGSLRENEAHEMVRTAVHCAHEFELEFIALNFSGLRFINSIGLTQMLSLKRQLTQKRIKLALVSLSDAMKRVFEKTQFSELFPCFENVNILIEEKIHEKRR